MSEVRRGAGSSLVQGGSCPQGSQTLFLIFSFHLYSPHTPREKLLPHCGSSAGGSAWLSVTAHWAERGPCSTAGRQAAAAEGCCFHSRSGAADAWRQRSRAGPESLPALLQPAVSACGGGSSGCPQHPEPPGSRRSQRR